MSSHSFHAYRGEVLMPPDGELLPLPVRAEMDAQVFGGQELSLGVLLDELALFLSEHPEFSARYAATAGTLAWLAGLRAGLDGDIASAERHFKRGLETRPADPLLRSNYGLVLHLQERKAEALDQYEMVLAGPEPAGSPEPAGNVVVRLLAARLHAEAGRYQRAYELLASLEGLLTTDAIYQALLDRVKERAGLVDDLASGARPPAPATRCTSCGAEVEPDEQFCGMCGRPVSESAAPAVRRSFCVKCGARLVEGQRSCSRCGWTG